MRFVILFQLFYYFLLFGPWLATVSAEKFKARRIYIITFCLFVAVSAVLLAGQMQIFIGKNVPMYLFAADYIAILAIWFLVIEGLFLKKNFMFVGLNVFIYILNPLVSIAMQSGWFEKEEIITLFLLQKGMVIVTTAFLCIVVLYHKAFEHINS